MPVRRIAITVSIVLSFSAALLAQQIQGDYLETRSADVYTGQCFANGEVNLVGNQAILAWHVRRGSWDGVRLDGLTVAAAVRARGTLGDPYENPYPAQAVLIVDEQASAALEKLFGVKSLDKAIEVQTEFAKTAYEGFVAEATKLSELYTDLAKETYKPFETLMAKAK